MPWVGNEQTQEPDSRLTRACHAAAQHLANSPDTREDDRFIILALNAAGDEGGAGSLGYQPGDPIPMANDMIEHLNGLLAAFGMGVRFVPFQAGSMN